MLSVTFNDQVLYLEGDLQVHHLESIREQMLALAADPNPLTLELSQVENIDLAGLQMALAFLCSRKGETKVIGAGMEFNKALNISGLAPHFARFM